MSYTKYLYKMTAAYWLTAKTAEKTTYIASKNQN